MLPPPRLLRRERSPLAFVIRPIMHEEWHYLLQTGWSGPDGSSNSLDDIEGIRIGVTTVNYEDADLPSSLHDFLYELGRRFGLSREFRKAADKLYRDTCLERVAVLIGWSGWKARRRCRIRYWALRLFADHAWWRYRESESETR